MTKEVTNAVMVSCQFVAYTVKSFKETGGTYDRPRMKKMPKFVEKIESRSLFRSKV